MVWIEVFSRRGAEAQRFIFRALLCFLWPTNLKLEIGLCFVLKDF